jgi:hypothetical protein
MKNLLLFLVLTAGIQGAFAQTNNPIRPDSIPKPVSSAFKEQFPMAKGMTWTKTKRVYRAGWTNAQKMEQYADYDSTGKLISANLELKKESLPPAVTEYLQSNYPGQPIGKIYKVTKENVDNYLVKISDKWLLFDDKGALVPTK